MSTDNDTTVLRDLARQVAEVAAKPIQDERRRLWSDHMAMQTTRPPVLVRYGKWNQWHRQVFSDENLSCEGEWNRHIERDLRSVLLHDTIGDDHIVEPWFTLWATRKHHPDGLWGVKIGHIGSNEGGGSWKFDPPIREWSDVDKLVAPVHEIDQEATARAVEYLTDLFGDILQIDVRRGPLCRDFQADLSTDLAGLRGLEQMMVDMYDAPQQLHKLVGFMQQAVLACQDAGEAAGDYSLTFQENQAEIYCHGLEPPHANSGPRKRKDLWCHCSAQEFALVSAEMHDEFLLQYQLPIIRQFGLVAYGCCEDLTRKINMLRQIPNLRQIAVSPMADIEKCAEQIGTDYVISWRPSPADMVGYGFDEDRIRKTIGHAMDATKGLHVHVLLKDIETVGGEPERLARWVRVAREVIEERAS